MPFVAIDSDTGARVVITKLADPRTELIGRRFLCQLCREKVSIRSRSGFRTHFFHPSGCHSNYKTNPETPEHFAGKEYVAERFLPLLADHVSFVPEYEVPIPEVMRVADVLTWFRMGWGVAHEIQLSAIGVDDLQKRTDDYLAAGIDVVWWFGKSADTATNREWAVNRQRFSLGLTFEGGEVSGCRYWYRDVFTDEYGRKNKILRSKAGADEVKACFISWWLDYAFARYYQVWRKGNNETYVRGLGAAKRALASFNGKTGAGSTGNNRWCKKEVLDGKAWWKVDLDVYLPRAERYEIAKRLPPSAIHSIKSRVKQRPDRSD